MKDEQLGSEIKRAITKVVEQEIQDEVKRIQQNVEQRVRMRVGEIVSKIFDYMDFRRDGRNLTIRVEFPKDDAKETEL